MRRYLEKRKRGTDNFPFAYYRQQYSNQMVKLHWHPEFELICVISGSLAVTVSQEKYILREGEILFINPEELHSYAAFSQEVHYHAAVFDPSLFQFKVPHFFEQEFIEPIINGVLRFPRMIGKENENHALISPIVDQLFNDHIHSKTMVFADLTLLFCTLIHNGLLEQGADDSAFKQTEEIKRCVRYMEENFNQKITLTELADLIHLNPNYFCHYFKKQTGLTPFAQLNNIRIHRAAKMLRQTDNSIAEIAEACGYENTNYFIRRFKETRGCTPSAYRKGENG